MLDSSTLDAALDVRFTFERRPEPIPCDLRIGWRLHLLVLLIDQCWGGKATHQQLHVLNWAIRTEHTRATFLQFIEGERAPNQIIVRYDPSLNRAVDFAFAEGLAAHHDEGSEFVGDAPPRHGTYRVTLTSKGKGLAKSIRGWKDSFEVELAFLESLGRKVTQQQVEALFTWGTE